MSEETLESAEDWCDEHWVHMRFDRLHRPPGASPVAHEWRCELRNGSDRSPFAGYREATGATAAEAAWNAIKHGREVIVE